MLLIEPMARYSMSCHTYARREDQSSWETWESQATEHEINARDDRHWETGLSQTDHCLDEHFHENPCFPHDLLLPFSSVYQLFIHKNRICKSFLTSSWRDKESSSLFGWLVWENIAWKYRVGGSRLTDPNLNLTRKRHLISWESLLTNIMQRDTLEST